MIYTIEEIKSRIIPIARKYELQAVYLFGSYARNEATTDSDVDILIDRNGSKIKTLFDMGGFFNETQDALGKKIDIVTVQSLEEEYNKKNNPGFAENLYKERVCIYEQ